MHGVKPADAFVLVVGVASVVRRRDLFEDRAVGRSKAVPRLALDEHLVPRLQGDGLAVELDGTFTRSSI